MVQSIALTIGVNSVDRDRYADWPGTLYVAERDARDMASLLKAHGFDCTTLVTEDATREAVTKNILNVAGKLKSGDLFVLTFAGHGTTLLDNNNDEDNHLDETWCLYDSLIVDDELHQLWCAFAPGVRIVVVSDSCHSGSIQKQMHHQTLDAVPGAGLVRAMPRAIADRVARAHKDSHHLGAAVLPQTVRARLLLLAACEEDGKAIEGDQNGVFTAALKKVWGAGNFQGNYQQFREKIELAIANGQVPVLATIGADAKTLTAESVFKI